MIHQTDVPLLVRKSRGIFENTDSKELTGYVSKKGAEIRKKLEVDALKNEINTIREQLTNINEMLKQVLERK